MLPGDPLRAVDRAFAAFAAAPSGPPGLAWGVVNDGVLIHAGGAGTLVAGADRRPGPESVFRIASMTKSFTAATILLLRDEGRLTLDDPVARHVPELVDLRGPTRDSPPVTIRHLLTMSAGLATDDPWGDRLQGLPLDDFADLLRGGVDLAWPPGTTFEYSNLGYGILGRVITRAAGREYREVVAERVLRPMGMTATTYLPGDVAPDMAAQGYVQRDERFEPEPVDGYGALASMGGIFSSVADLARWVAGFAAAFPARDDPEDGHPLSRAARREMQQVHRAFPPEMTFDGSGGPPTVAAGGYGFGLFIAPDVEIGLVVGHSGGYPGFGSTMRWHPATGLGVIALANSRYAHVSAPAAEALRALVRGRVAPGRRVAASPSTGRLRGAADRLLSSWDEALADAVFAPNMDLDEPRERRRAQVAGLHERFGVLLPDDEPVTSTSPSDATWWLRGEQGRVRLELLATPEREPKIQALNVTPAANPGPALAALAERIVALLGADAPSWPRDIAIAAGVDRSMLERGLRAAAIALGACTVGKALAGDGERATTLALLGAQGSGEIRLEVDGDGAIVKAAIVPARIAGPVEAP